MLDGRGELRVGRGVRDHDELGVGAAALLATVWIETSCSANAGATAASTPALVVHVEAMW